MSQDFKLDHQLINWLTLVVRKHVSLDDEDVSQFDGIIRDAKFYQVVMQLQIQDQGEGEGYEADRECT